jgi:hypothetical protein
MELGLHPCVLVPLGKFVPAQGNRYVCTPEKGSRDRRKFTGSDASGMLTAPVCIDRASPDETSGFSINLNPSYL